MHWVYHSGMNYLIQAYREKIARSFESSQDWIDRRLSRHRLAEKVGYQQEIDRQARYQLITPEFQSMVDHSVASYVALAGQHLGKP